MQCIRLGRELIVRITIGWNMISRYRLRLISIVGGNNGSLLELGI